MSELIKRLVRAWLKCRVRAIWRALWLIDGTEYEGPCPVCLQGDEYEGFFDGMDYWTGENFITCNNCDWWHHEGIIQTRLEIWRWRFDWCIGIPVWEFLFVRDARDI